MSKENLCLDIGGLKWKFSLYLANKRLRTATLPIFPSFFSFKKIREEKFLILLLVGSLSNDDGDGNWNSK